MAPEEQQQQQLIFNEEEKEEAVTNLLLLKPTTTTTTIEMRERMLDVFPLSEQEIDTILIGYREFTDINNTYSTDNNNNRTIGFSSFHKKQNDDEEVVHEQQQQPNNNNMELLLKEIEYRFCLKSNLLIETALSQVLLIGTGYDESLEFKFLEAISILLGRRGSKNLLSILYKVAEAESTATTTTTTTSSDGGTAIIVQPKVLIGLIYRLILASYSLKTSQSDISVRDTIPQAWVSSLQEYAIKTNSSESGITLQIWLDWTSFVLPQAYQTLSTYVNYAIFTSNNHPSTRPGSSPILQFPNLMTIQSNNKNEESLFIPLYTSFWKYSYQTIPSSLALLSANFGATWYNLYTSDIDGLSFETFQHALLSYSGTTVILIQTTTGDAFGFYTECPWKESRKWYGSNNEDICDEDEGGYFESFLFGLKPTLQFYGPTDIGGGVIKGKKKRFNMFLNNPLNTSTRPAGELTGLAIGGISDRTPRIHIPPSLEQCKAGSMDGVYDCGPLLSNDELFFNIDVMEVWAISSSETDFQRGIKAGKAQASVKEAHRIARATIDRAQFLEDFQSGQYMNTLFAHREQARGRHSFCAADEEESGYFLDSKIPSARKVTS